MKILNSRRARLLAYHTHRWCVSSNLKKMSDEKLLTLKDLFEHKVKDLYSSQEQLETAYQKMAQHVSHDTLKAEFEKYQQETKENRSNIEFNW